MTRECVCEEFHPRAKKTLTQKDVEFACFILRFFFLLEMAVAFAPEVVSSPNFAGVLVTGSKESRATRTWSSLQLCGQFEAGVLRIFLLASRRVLLCSMGEGVIASLY